jgi:hypothetical protein
MKRALVKPAGRKRGAVNFLVVLVASTAILVVCEVVARVSKLAYEPQYDQRAKVSRRSANAELRKELIPGFDGDALGGRVHVNSHGFRGSEVANEKPSGVTRICVVGDSWAFGWGVDQEHVVTAVMQRRLAALGKSCEVLNFAVPGYNLQQQEIVLREKVLGFSPDILIIAFNINDLEHIRTGKAMVAAESETVTDPVSFRARMWMLLRRIEIFGNTHSHLFRLLDNVLRSLSIQASSSDFGKSAYFNKFYEEGSSSFVFLRDAFRRVEELANTEGFEVCVVYCPWMIHLNDDNPYRETFARVANVGRSNGFSTIDLFPVFLNRNVSELRISAIDGHPNSLGHEIAADSIATFLLREYDSRLAGVAGR